MRRAGHADDVIDAAWAPDGTALLTGSIENVCVVWDTEKHRPQGRLTEHGHYVQGVAWDPAQQYVVSQSADRTCRHAPACTRGIPSDIFPFLTAMKDCESFCEYSACTFTWSIVCGNVPSCGWLKHAMVAQGPCCLFLQGVWTQGCCSWQEE